MALHETLLEWQQFAHLSATIKDARRKVAAMEEEFSQAQVKFQKGLQALEDVERQSILAIMKAYESERPEEAAAANGNHGGPHRDRSLRWLLNKVGNEGVEGIAWSRIVDAWSDQFKNATTDALYQTMNSHRNLFHTVGESTSAVLTLTSDGQAQFLKNA